jgi:hypothetical protein
VYDVNKLKEVETLFFDEKIDIVDIALLMSESVTTIDMMICDILAKITPSGDTISE